MRLRRLRDPAGVRAYQRAYYEDNLDRMHDKQREWRMKNGAVINARIRSLRATPEARAAMREYLIEWRKQNRVSIAQRRGEQRARRHGVVIEAVGYAEILERDGYWCYLCNVPVEHHDLSFDHVVPLVAGGSHTAKNIRVTHVACNVAKGVKSVAA